MREMVSRERSERVAHVRAIASMIARVVGMDADKLLGDVVADYASEVHQESYDPEMLARKAARLREAQAAIRRRQREDALLVKRLERMETLGQKFDSAKKRFGRNPDSPTDSNPLKHRLKSKRG